MATLGLSSKAVGLRKRPKSSLHAFSILAFGTSASFGSQSLPFNAVALMMFNGKPTGFGRISNSDLPVAFLDEFNRVVQMLGRFR